MNGSISLMRANPALTTNVKLIVDSKYNLYLESYSANTELSAKRFKKFLINSDSFLSERIASFYKDLPTNIAFEVRNDIKNDIIQNDYNNQLDDIYYSGAKNIEDTRYVEEFQYNTTLKIDPNNLPKYFFILRHDGPGDVNLQQLELQDYIKNLKIVKTFDLTPTTNLGKLWKKNYIDDDVIFESPLELNFKPFEFSKWNGYDYYTGGTVTKSLFMNDYIQNQTTDFEFESFLIDGFEKNGVVSSNYSNISFLFDDTVSGVFVPYNNLLPDETTYSERDYPWIKKLLLNGEIPNNTYNSTTKQFRFTEYTPYRKKWSINKYTGFYLDDLIFYNKITSYQGVYLKINQNIIIINNVFKTSTNENIDPVLSIVNDELPKFIKIDNEFYFIEKNNILDNNNNIIDTEYVIISDKIINNVLLDDIINMSQQSVDIIYESISNSLHRPVLYNNNGSLFNDDNLTEYFDNGIVTIKIQDQFYKLNKDIDGTEKIYINTDEYITCNVNTLYRKLGNDEARRESMQVLKKDFNVIYFEIYVLKLTDIKDWDYSRTNTKFSAIEYDTNNSISYNRPFLYNLNVKDTTIPIDLYLEKNYNIWVNNNKINTDSFLLPISSEYAASGDLYVLNEENKIGKIWDLNQSITKWGITNSLNTNAYPYKINNSLDVAGVYNLTPNMYEQITSIDDLTLDWFYTFGKPVNYIFSDNSIKLIDTNQTNNIINRTLNIDLPIFTPDNIYNTYRVDFDYYKDKNAKFNYFDFILGLYQPFLNNDEKLIQQQKYAVLQDSDSVNGPLFYFKGLCAYLQWVDLENPNNNNSKYNVIPAKDLSGYKFSSVFNAKQTTDTELHGKCGIDIIVNKIYKNILINMFMYTPIGGLTSLDYRVRDNVYNEDFVKYFFGGEFGNMFSAKWVQSGFKVQSLNLNNIINILIKNSVGLQDENFQGGINYIVVEDTIEYKIDSITNNVNEVTIKFTNEVPFKENEWFYFINNSVVSTVYDNINLQISEKIDNKTIIIKFNDDQTSVVTSINTILSDIIITKEKSVLPFRFKIVEPQEIKINTEVNKLIDADNLNFSPINTFKNNKDIVIDTTSETGLIPNVYVDDSKIRKFDKQQQNIELTYDKILKLPSIFRFDGNYEPILNDIDLFNTSKLIKIGSYNITNINTSTQEITLSTLPTNLKINDIIYFEFADDYVELSYKTATIVEINNNIIKINIPLVTNNIPNINIHIFKFIEKNTTFEYKFKDLALIKDITIAKVYNKTNPFQSNNDVYKVTNRYAYFDEHGITEVNKNIFKSTWDLEFYKTTLSNKYKTK